MSWLKLSGEMFEQDEARAAAQRDEALRLHNRAMEIHERQAPASK